MYGTKRAEYYGVESYYRQRNRVIVRFAQLSFLQLLDFLIEYCSDIRGVDEGERRRRKRKTERERHRQKTASIRTAKIGGRFAAPLMGRSGPRRLEVRPDNETQQRQTAKAAKTAKQTE